ncbi:uncharacterized protein PGTG_20113 [Puccinia graminis f. sp. tritici CRL 75-36-700-3]|uniref:Uncharacterized protein n=1 Tax=Puccinia graminis f. sp. tritici (strain CRL 75-36-700-3 / race SCCL) TaxID=418459 RepID=E3NXB4_PUCGT|nr:uncharacterized protein PGTG_20113 [Puccinia graminis f. sp. tritici CRL 75-36-700-3]EFP94213.1 hypothetical protein PGTG_20113 [Puccinia graminis f. sp. tritici CRL 75-36-700-3]
MCTKNIFHYLNWLKRHLFVEPFLKGFSQAHWEGLLIFDRPTTTSEAPKDEKNVAQESQQDPAEEQIYIVADRLLRQDDPLEKSIKDGIELSLETQRLLLKIKGQLNPPDIISISIRKLIQDELEKVDQRLLLVSDRWDEDNSEDEDQGEDEWIEAESEQVALASLLENFKTEMLDLSWFLIELIGRVSSR